MCAPLPHNLHPRLWPTAFSGVPENEITDVVIDSFGSILVTGMAETDGNGDTGFFIGRISPDGVAGTYEVTPFPFQVPNDPTEYSNAGASCAEIRPDGRILVAGYDVDDDGLVIGLGLACYNAYDGLSQRLWVEHDANYNVTSIADVTGTVVQRFQEDPYGGNVVVLNGNWQLTTDNYTWLYIQQGGRYDSVAGVIHFDNRDLDPNTGAWRTPDPNPAGPYVDGMDTYQFVCSSPLDGVDPMGMELYPVSPFPQNRYTPPPTPPPRRPNSTPEGNCMQWTLQDTAVSSNVPLLRPAFSAGVLTRTIYVHLTDDQMFSDANLYFRILDTWFKSKGGIGATADSPPRPGYRKVAAYIYINKDVGPDHHWTTQCSDGRWVGQDGTNNNAWLETTPDKQAKVMTLVGFWYVPGSPRTNPLPPPLPRPPNTDPWPWNPYAPRGFGGFM